MIKAAPNRSGFYRDKGFRRICNPPIFERGICNPLYFMISAA